MTEKLPPSEGSGPFQELIGLKYSKIEKGHSQCVLEVSQKLLNFNKRMHGGAIYAMADAAMGGALYSSLNEDEVGTTIEVKITYFKAVTSGSLTADAKVIHKSRKLASLEAELRNDGHLVAKALATWYISKAKRD
jgi:uncharacterized protein (TIGR00369 family)